ncbi:hypothetical protein ElyMa_002588900 [Elysia marginata]|uniref:Mutator-like transposase domain-containing protein n=1 Tax=Elysia marginata TaxID=1093978 RepID=A0AAV4H3B1_9GAST|nr:hypothetical protein ElyMa_002588900 [Elysia marginata]
MIMDAYSKKEVIMDAYSKKEEQLPNEHGCMEIAASFDGSWLTRGHKSLIGIGCVVDVLTGLVLDTHVMSQHCQSCALVGKKLKLQDQDAYRIWYEGA